MDIENDYEIKPASYMTTEVSDIPIYVGDDGQNHKFRKIIRAEYLRTEDSPESALEITLMYQRRHNGSTEWQDVPSFNCACLKGGEQVRIALGHRETFKLYETLRDLYEIYKCGIPGYECKLKVVNAEDAVIADGMEKQTMEYLLECYPDFWEALKELSQNPDMAGKLRPELLGIAEAEQKKARTEALETFEYQMMLSDWDEPEWKENEWDKFFQQNQWIFGHGLCYRFLSQLDNQAYYGGKGYDGHGGQVGDRLMASSANLRFTVLVEIKTPETPLVGDLYRNGAHSLSKDLTGAVAQMQANCETWATEAITNARNIRDLESKGIFTCEPKGILVVGNTRTLDTPEKLFTFERFRRNLHNPDIITYDELLVRAQVLVEDYKQV